MRRIVSLLLLSVLVLATSCIKQYEKTYQGTDLVEIDATVLNSPTSGFTYPILTRVPKYGKPVAGGTVDPAISRTMADKVVKLRVNLISEKGVLDADQVIAYKVLDPLPAPLVVPGTGQLAVSGTHYTTTGTLTIPAGSTYGEIVVNVLDTGTSSTVVREVHIELVGNTTVKPSKNYKFVAIRIAQT